MGKQGKFNKGVVSSVVIITLMLFLLLSSDIFVHSNRWIDIDSTNGFLAVTGNTATSQQFLDLDQDTNSRAVAPLEPSLLSTLPSRRMVRPSKITRIVGTNTKQRDGTEQPAVSGTPLPSRRKFIARKGNHILGVSDSFKLGGLIHDKLSTANKLNVSRSFVVVKPSLSDNNSGKPGDAKQSFQMKVNARISSSQLDYRKRLPQAIIVGAKKSGTKALLSFLSANPFVKACDREVHYFDKNWPKGSNWYREQMPPSRPGDITIEKSPRYFISSQAPKRMFQLLPNVTLLFIFRNPMIRALSDYSHIVAKKRKVLSKDGHRSTFEDSVFNNRSTFKINDSNPVVDTGRYIVHLTRWMRYFARKQMHFVDGDNIIKKPWEEIVAAQRFLKLPVLVDRSNFVYNKSKGFYCVRNTSIGKKYGQMRCLGKNKGRTHPKISLKTRNVLNNFFKPYNELLYKVTNKDFHWTEDVS